MAKETIVTNDKGVRFTARKIEKGDRFGVDNKMVHEGRIPIVTFLDGTKEIASYDVETLEEVSETGGLDLNTSVDNWELSQENIKSVLSRLK